MRTSIIFTFLFVFNFCFSQSFEGIITFKIDYPEMMLKTIPEQFKDSVKVSRKYIRGNQIRTENYTGMGKQVLLEKVGSDTSYLMFNLMGDDIAVEIIGSSKPESKKDSLTVTGKAKKMFGKKCKKATYIKNGKEYEIIYTDQIDAKYGNSFTKLGGLALVYPIVLSEFETLIYTCTDIKETEITDDFFRIPNNFRVVSMEEFGKMIGG